MQELATESKQLLQQLEKRLGPEVIQLERRLLQLRRSTPYFFYKDATWSRVIEATSTLCVAIRALILSLILFAAHSVRR